MRSDTHAVLTVEYLAVVLKRAFFSCDPVARFRSLARAHSDAENAIAEMTVGDPQTLKKLRDEAGLSSSE